MIKYSDGRVVLNVVEKEELKSIYDSGGRRIEIYDDICDGLTVNVYPENDACGEEQVFAKLFGSTAQALYEIIGFTKFGYMASLKKLIDKYVC